MNFKHENINNKIIGSILLVDLCMLQINIKNNGLKYLNETDNWTKLIEPNAYWFFILKLYLVY